MTKKSSIRRLYTRDNLPVLRSMDSATVDLIYLDPPFNSGKQWENPIGEGDKKALASFKDTWELSDTHADEEYALGLAYPAALPLIDALYEINGGSWKAYLIYMGARLAEMRRLLKPSGSIYYHCDPVMSHGVKLLMDSIFGEAKFINEVVWHYTNASRGKYKFAKSHDVILWFGKSKKSVFNRKDILVPFASGMTEWRYTKGGQAGKEMPKGKTPDDVWLMPSLNAMSKERTGYPTQKPLALLERIIKASSDQGDLVLDPFCGCATTCLAAERLSRQWIGIDLAEEAANLVKDRLKKYGEGVLEFAAYEVEHLRKLPPRTDLRGLRTDDAILKPRLYKKQDGECYGCEKKTRIELMDFDHIIASSRGGQNIDENVQLLCGNCNSIKGDRGMHYLWRQILQRRSQQAMSEYEAKRRLRQQTRGRE